MDFLTMLWLPIVVSAAAVWIASALCWMAIGHHTKDVRAIPNEQEFMDTVRRMGIPPGNYGFPDFQACKRLKGAEKKAHMERMWKTGPLGMLRVWGPMSMGGNMVGTFVYFLVTSTVIGYLGWITLGPRIGNQEVAGGETFGHVMKAISIAAILAYCFASFPNDLWFQKSRRAMLMSFIDGVVFGLVTGAVFAWLWPK